MYSRSVSARRNREFDSANDHGLALVEAPHDHGNVTLRVDALSKHYGAIEAVSDVSFDVREGEIFGLLGLNGAGKTTLISMLATERRPSAGDAMLLGHSVRDERAEVRRMIGVAPQEIALYPMLTGAENLRFFGRIYASDQPARNAATDESAGLDYDPWEPVNARTFDFNFNVLDRYAMKPAAEVWARALPQYVRQGLANVFDNIAMPKRFVNKVLQGRLPGAGEEIARFVLNTTVGVAGFFDPAAHIGLHKSDADTGQTLGTYGIRPGPYLVLPILPPLDLRDAIGYAADSFMDPLSWFLTPLGADIGRSAAYTINERADHMTEYDDVEDTSLDLYAAVRNGYLQRREKFIRDAIRDRDRDWGMVAKPSHQHGVASLDDARPYDDGALLDIPGE